MLEPILNPAVYIKTSNANWTDLTDSGATTLHSHAVEGTALKSTGESGGTKFLREDGDGTCSWQAAGGGAVEGTAVLSTGESGGTKFLREDGDGTCSWQTPAGGVWSRTGTVLTPTTAGDDVSADTGDVIASDVYIGNNAAATNPTLNFITSGNDLTITYSQTAKQLLIPSEITMQASFTAGKNFLYIFPSYTLPNNTIATGITLTPEYTPAAGSTALVCTALFGYTLIKGTSNWAASSIVKGLDYGNVAPFFTTGGSTNITAVGIDCFGGGCIASNLTLGTATGLRATMSWGSGTLTATTGVGIQIQDGTCSSHSVTTQYQLWIDKPTKASTNYQVVLFGNGTGSGIWLDGTSGERLYSDGTYLCSASSMNAPGIKIGGTAVRATTEGTNKVDIFNGTAPVGTLTNGISIYSTSGECYIMDAAGNATLQSPHDKEGNWVFYSKHTPTGRVLKIHMEKFLRFLEDKFGTSFIEEYMEV